MADANNNQAQGQDSGKSKVGKLFLPVFALINLVTLGAGSYMVYLGTLGYHPPSLREPAAFQELKKKREEGGISESILYTMPAFTVNLAGTPRRLIRVEMAFDMLDKDGFEEIVRNSPAVRDAIVRILNEKTYDDIETIQGKLFLKDHIAVTLNNTFREGVVKEIYFNEFLVQ